MRMSFCCLRAFSTLACRSCRFLKRCQRLGLLGPWAGQPLLADGVEDDPVESGGRARECAGDNHDAIADRCVTTLIYNSIHLRNQVIQFIGRIQLEWYHAVVQRHAAQAAAVVGEGENGDWEAGLGKNASGVACPASHDHKLHLQVLHHLPHAPRYGGGDACAFEFLGGAVVPLRLGEVLFGLTCDVFHHLHGTVGKFPDGSLAAEHDRVGPVEYRISDVAHLGASGRCLADHALQHLRGDNDRLARGPAAAHQVFLDERDIGQIDLHAQVPPGDHQAVRLLQDRVDVPEGLGLLDFGNKLDVAVSFGEVLMEEP